MKRSICVRSGFNLPLVVALTLSLSGCGVIFGGTTKTISVASSPSVARLTTEPLTGSFTTPVTLTLERKKSYTLIAWKEGYRETQFPIRKKMRKGPLIIDILFTGLVGVVVDAATGGWWDLQPEEATITLERLDDSVPGPDVIEVTISTATADAAAPLRVESTEPVRVKLVQN
jgi:hypothetical protein